MQAVQILLWNVGYLAGRRDAFGGYLPSPREALVGNPGSERRAAEQVAETIARYRPDVVCLVEIDRGSFRTTTECQVADLLERLRQRGVEYAGEAYNKYGPSGVAGRLPFFRHLANAVLLPRELGATPQYLTTGMKRLVISTTLPGGVTMLVSHLSVRARSRRRQLEELATMVNRHRADGPVIVAGDLNTYRGHDELDDFTDATGLVPCAPGPTVQARPLDQFVMSSRVLDFFLCSPDLPVDGAEVLSGEVSDHQPVLLDIDAAI